SSQVLSALGERLAAGGVRIQRYGLSDFAAEDLLLARSEVPAARAYLAEIQAASAIVLATPVYKATYSGGLKVLLDLIPPDALRGKTVLTIATARLGRHFPGVQRALDDLYRFFEVGLAVPAVFLLDEQVRLGSHGLSYDPSAETAVDKAAKALLHALAAPGNLAEFRAELRAGK
ncbi:MAG TPA: NAD(P)H-dependent oxidoreductase, partial [Polyangiaceae bacterium]|nr:NAD(P)H-dependent oxidoreductase [Polyangiaceae bacterium]